MCEHCSQLNKKQPAPDVERLYQALLSFAGRVAQSDDPQLKEAAHNFQRALRESKIRV